MLVNNGHFINAVDLLLGTVYICLLIKTSNRSSPVTTTHIPAFQGFPPHIPVPHGLVEDRVKLCVARPPVIV
jgi:hypothetical protein